MVSLPSREKWCEGSDVERNGCILFKLSQGYHRHWKTSLSTLSTWCDAWDERAGFHYWDVLVPLGQVIRRTFWTMGVIFIRIFSSSSLQGETSGFGALHSFPGILLVVIFHSDVSWHLDNTLCDEATDACPVHPFLRTVRENIISFWLGHEYVCVRGQRIHRRICVSLVQKPTKLAAFW